MNTTDITASLARYDSAATHTSRDLTLEAQIERRYGPAPVVAPPLAPVSDDLIDHDAPAQPVSDSEE